MHIRSGSLVSMALFLAGCQGQGGWSTPTTTGTPASATSNTAEGVYTGTLSAGTQSASSQVPITQATGNQFKGIVLDNGAFYFLYYSTANGTPLIGGAIQGNSSSLNGNFSSINAKDFNVTGAGIANATVSGSYTFKQNLNGSVTYQNAASSTSFTSSYDPAYELQPNLSTLAGSYAGNGGELGAQGTVTLTIDAQGVITGQLSSVLAGNGQNTNVCNFSGMASPHAKGNVYDLSITFGGTGCTNGTNTATGVAYLSSASNQLYSVALNSDQSNGFLFIGAK